MASYPSSTRPLEIQTGTSPPAADHGTAKVVENGLVAMPLAIMVGTIAYAAGTANVDYVAPVAVLSGGMAVNYALKICIKQDRPPRGGEHRLTCSGTGRGPAGEYGMPSGHAQSMFTVLGFTIFWLVARTDRQQMDWKQASLIAAMVAGLATAVTKQRVVSECHTTKQVVVGGLLGLGIGGIGYCASSLFAPDTFPCIWKSDDEDQAQSGDQGPDPTGFAVATGRPDGTFIGQDTTSGGESWSIGNEAASSADVWPAAPESPGAAFDSVGLGLAMPRSEECTDKDRNCILAAPDASAGVSMDGADGAGPADTDENDSGAASGWGVW